MKVNDRNIELSNTNKILFSYDSITKRNLIEYYERIYSIMIPHIKNRPLMLERFPNGIDDDGFYQKEISDYFPEWIERVSVNKKEGEKIIKLSQKVYISLNHRQKKVIDELIWHTTKLYNISNFNMRESNYISYAENDKIAKVNWHAEYLHAHNRQQLLLCIFESSRIYKP